MRELRIPTLALLAWLGACRLLSGAEPPPLSVPQDANSESTGVTWETDYFHAFELADRQQKMLLIYFFDPANPLCQRVEQETLGDADVVKRLREFVCLRLATSATIPLDGQDTVLLQHSTLKEMQGQPGIAIADFVRPDPELHGHVVSAFPLTPRFWYGPQQMQVILDLPPGTLTQRTLIYAVRTHPERPASAAGPADARLLAEAQSHSDHQARIRLQGHHNWSARFPRISGLLGCSAREVCAESWPGQNLLEAAIECVRCWRLSSGHWSAVRARNRAFGYDMKLGSNGVWYATGIFGTTER